MFVETFEYKVIRTTKKEAGKEQILNKFGKDGWELISVSENVNEKGTVILEYFLKRRIYNKKGTILFNN